MISKPGGATVVVEAGHDLTTVFYKLVTVIITMKT